MNGQFARLASGLDAARIPWDAAQLRTVCERVLAANSLADAFIYFQATRGVPAPGEPVRARVLTGTVKPTIFAYATPTPPLSAYAEPPVKSAITAPDTRWLRGHVKSISLMGSVMAAMEASEAHADDAILIRTMVGGEKFAAEGTSANLIAVVDAPPTRSSAKAGPHAASIEIVTPPLDGAPILAGITRDILLQGAARRGVALSVRNLHERELLAAREIMLCGTLTMVTAITRLNGRAVGAGTPGPEATRLLRILVEDILRDT
jgi:D-alanine transaminase